MFINTVWMHEWVGWVCGTELLCLYVEEIRMQENKKFTHLWHNIFFEEEGFQVATCS
jgi:hypothetical protein